MSQKKSRISAVPEHKYGVCVWELEDDTGNFLRQGEYYLSMEGKLGDLEVELRMKAAAKYHIGDKVELGRPVWLPGGRKISDMEHDDQMERLLDGKIPDEVDEVKQFLGKKK